MDKILLRAQQKDFLKHKKFAIFLCAFLLFSFLITPLFSFAADPGKHLGFQGQLLNTSAAPQTGTYTMTFSFYDDVSAGSLQGSTITKSVSVANGYFAVDFSESDLTGVVFNKDLWMEMSVDGTTLSPRSPVNSVPYSNVAFGVISGAGAPTIANPADGALYFDTTANVVYVYDGSSWIDLANGSSFAGNIVLGTTSANTLTINSTIQGGSPFIFEGASADAFETTFSIADPTVDRTITFPNATGTVALWQSASGDITFTSSGVGTITTGAVTTGKILDGTIATADLGNNSVDGTKISLTSEVTGDTMYYDGTDWVHSSAFQNNGTDIAATGNFTIGGNITGTGALAISSLNTTALTLDSGTTGAVNLGTGANAKNVTIGNLTGATAIMINSGADSTGGGVLIRVPDNVAGVFRVRQGSNNYISLATTNSSESLTFGNTTTNPSFNFSGTGATIFGGAINVTGYSTFSAGLSANSNRIQDVATPISVNDATSKNYVDTLFSSSVTYTSPVYDLASSDPGVTPNGRRYIDTTDWNGCGVGSIVISDGIGFYNCDQVAATGLTASVTNLGETYNFNGSAWVSTGSTVNHNSLNGIQGGEADEYYHLDFTDYSALTDGNAQLPDLLTTGSPTFDVISISTDIFIGDGGVSDPSYTFNNDTDTGMYRVGVNKIGFTTGGVQGLIIGSNQNVGIGDFSLSDPTYKLDVAGTTRIQNALYFDESANPFSIIGFDVDDGNGVMMLTGGHNGAPTEGAKITLNGIHAEYEGGDLGALGLYAADNGWIRNFTGTSGSAERLAISPTGGVGINTSSYVASHSDLPSGDKLTVFGNIGNIFDETRQSEDITQVGDTLSTFATLVGVATQGGYTFLIDSNSNELISIDMTPDLQVSSSPVVISRLSLSIRPRLIKVVGRYAYIASDTALQVFDISDPTNMNLLVEVFPSDELSVYDMEVSGSYLYLLARKDSSTTAIKVFDINYPETGLPEVLDRTVSADDSIDMTIEGKYLYVADTNPQDVSVYDISDHLNPVWISAVTTQSTPETIKVSGKYMYIMDIDNRFSVVDISNKTNMQVVGGRSLSSNVSDMFIVGRYAYLVNTDNELYVIDTENTVDPVLVKVISLPFRPSSLVVQGKKIIIVGGESVATFDASGIETSNALVHSLEVGTLAIQNDLSVTGDIIGGALNVTNGGIHAVGDVSILGGLSFTGPLYLSANSGTSGQYLKSNGAGASPEWTTLTTPSVSLDQITGATANGNLHSDSYTQTWYWSLTGSSNAFVINEDTASSGTGYMFYLNTKASSNAKPLTVLAREVTIINTTARGDLTLGGASGSLSTTISSGTDGIAIGNDNVAKTITIGSSSGSTLSFNAGTGGTVFNISNGAFTLVTGSGTINIAGDSTSNTVNIGTGAGAKTVTLGSTTTTSSLALNSGTGALNIGTSIAKTITIGNVTGATAVNINAGSGGSLITTTNSTLGLISGTGAINIGADAAAKTITLGNITGATAVNVNTGTGGTTYTTTNGIFTLATGTGTVTISGDATANAINIGTGAGAKTVTLGSTTTTSSLALNSGTGALNIGTSIAKTITIGNVTGATAVNINAGSGGSAIATTNANFTLTTGTGSILIGNEATTQNIFIGSASGAKSMTLNTNTGTLNISTDTGSNSINIATGAAAKTITLGNSTSTTNISLNTGTGSSLNLGTNAIAHTVTLGNVTGATAVNINSGTGGSTYTTTNGIFTLNTGTGAISIGTDATNKTITLGNITSSSALTLDTGSGGINIGTSQAKTISIGNTTSNTVLNLNAGNSSNAITIAANGGDIYLQSGVGTMRIATDSTAQTIYLGTGGGAKTVIIGSTNTTSGTYINSGSNGVYLQSYGAVINLVPGIGTINIAADATASALNIGTGAGAKTVTLGSTNSTSSLTLEAGTGALNIGTGAFAKTITIGNVTGATAVNVNTGTGGLTETTTNGAYTLTTGTGTISIGADATVNTISIGTGVAGKTINIGSTSTATFALKASSAVTIQGSGTTCSIGDGTGATSCTSDQRLKQNITDLDDETLAKVLALRPVLFNWNDISGHDQSISHIGLIAQEVQGQFGDAVHKVYHSDTLNDDVLGVDYAYLVVPAIKAIQEQQALLGDILTLEGMTTLVSDIENETAHDASVIIAEKIQSNTKFLTDFVVARVTAIRGYFGEIFAKKATLDEVCLKDTNGVSCYTRSQLDAVVNNNTQPPQNTQTPTPPTETTTETPPVETTTDTTDAPAETVETPMDTTPAPSEETVTPPADPAPAETTPTEPAPTPEPTPAQ